MGNETERAPAGAESTGLWFNNPATPEGKYPIVLRRDGTPVETPYMVLLMRDPCFDAAMLAYADEAERRGFDPRYVADIRDMAARAPAVREAIDVERKLAPSDPDAKPHRRDDPVTLAWARSLRRKQPLASPPAPAPLERLRAYGVMLAKAMNISAADLDVRVEPCDVPGFPAWHATMRCGGSAPGLWFTARGFGVTYGDANDDRAVKGAIGLLSAQVDHTLRDAQRLREALASEGDVPQGSV